MPFTSSPWRIATPPFLEEDDDPSLIAPSSAVVPPASSPKMSSATPPPPALPSLDDSSNTPVSSQASKELRDLIQQRMAQKPPSLTRQIIGTIVGGWAPGIGQEIASPGTRKFMQQYNLLNEQAKLEGQDFDRRMKAEDLKDKDWNRRQLRYNQLIEQQNKINEGNQRDATARSNAGEQILTPEPFTLPGGTISAPTPQREVWPEQMASPEASSAALAPATDGKVQGMLEPGNIDLKNRPKVRNADGTTSTVRTITVESDGKTLLLPTVIGGTIVSNKEAIDHWRKTGEHMGVFASEADADNYDKQLHNQMGWDGAPGSEQAQWQASATKSFTPQGPPTLQPLDQNDPQSIVPVAKLPGFSGISQPKVPEGYYQVPRTSYDPKDALRVKPTQQEIARQRYEASTEETPKDILDVFPDSPKRMTIAGIQGTRQAIINRDQREADRIATKERADEQRAFQAQQNDLTRQNQQLLAQMRQASTGPAADDAKAIADAIRNGEQPPTMTGLYRMAAPVRAELARQGYDMSTAQRDWDAIRRHMSTLNGPQQERLRQAITFTYDSLDQIDDLYNQWKKVGSASGLRVLNRAALATSKQLPGEAGAVAQNLEAQINDLISELGTVYRGGNASTDETLKLAAQNLGADWNEETFRRAMDQIRKTLTIRKNSIMTSTPVGVSSDSPYLPQSQGGASAPASTVARKAMGGYEIGVKYGGQEYLGGDPNDPASWKK